MLSLCLSPSLFRYDFCELSKSQFANRPHSYRHGSESARVSSSACCMRQQTSITYVNRKQKRSAALSGLLLCFWSRPGCDRYANAGSRSRDTSSLTSSPPLFTNWWINGRSFPVRQHRRQCGAPLTLSRRCLHDVYYTCASTTVWIFAREQSAFGTNAGSRLALGRRGLVVMWNNNDNGVSSSNGIEGAAGKEAIMRYDVWSSLCVSLVSVTHRLTRGQELTLTSQIFG